MGDEALGSLSDDELGRYVRETPVFRLAVACARFEDGVREIKENDEIAWRKLIRDTQNAQGRVNTTESVRSVVDAFLDNIEEYAALARRPEDVADRATEELVEEDEDDG